MKIAVLILAAGKGGRFGMPKWKAVQNNETFLELIVKTLCEAKIDSINCIYRENSKPDLTGLSYILNENPEYGMFSSLFYGTHHLKNEKGILIWPVDHPFVKTETILRLIEKFKIDNKSVIKPLYNGIGGHPVILPNLLINRINSVDYDGGLRKLIIDSGINVINLPVEDENILRNINTVADLAASNNQISN